MNVEIVRWAIYLVVTMTLLTGIVLVCTKRTEDREVIKIRFAAVTFTGILTLFVFAALMYIASGEEGPGKEIFDKGLTAMFTLAGTVVGYLFGSAARPDAEPKPPGGG